MFYHFSFYLSNYLEVNVYLYVFKKRQSTNCYKTIKKVFFEKININKIIRIFHSGRKWQKEMGGYLRNFDRCGLRRVIKKTEKKVDGVMVMIGRRSAQCARQGSEVVDETKGKYGAFTL